MDVDTSDPTARWHNKTGKPFETFQGLVELHYPKARTLDEWFYFSQLNQRDAMRAAIEHYRTNGRCKGALLWQLNDCWPVESWSVLEFGGRMKAVAYELPRLFANLLLKIDLKEGEVTLSACLHNADSPVGGKINLSAFDLKTGDRVVDLESKLKIEPNQSAEIVKTSHDPGRSLLWVAKTGDATAAAHTGRPIGTKTPDLTHHVKNQQAEIISETPLIDLYIEDVQNPENSFEPNFINLLAGDRVLVKATGPIDKLRFRCLDFGP
jgi:beta-mannosidase